MIVQTLIQHAAAQQKKTAADVTQHLLDELHTHSVREIKSHQMREA